MNTQGFIPFTNLIHHGGRISTCFVDSVTRKRVRKPVTLTLPGIPAGSKDIDLSIGEAREMLRALEAALVRADQFRGCIGAIDPATAEAMKSEDRQAIRSTLSVVSSQVESAAG
jgi:hypothetical protein